jgi:hypothetical protein
MALVALSHGLLSYRPSPTHGVCAFGLEEKNIEVYYESIKREPKIRGINKCRCDERLQNYNMQGKKKNEKKIDTVSGATMGAGHLPFRCE